MQIRARPSPRVVQDRRSELQSRVAETAAAASAHSLATARGPTTPSCVLSLPQHGFIFDVCCSVLEEARHAQRAVMVVRPAVIVPDTNCFLDQLGELQRTLALDQYTIIMPLIGAFICKAIPPPPTCIASYSQCANDITLTTVLGELEGLARGTQADSSSPVSPHVRYRAIVRLCHLGHVFCVSEQLYFL